KSLLDRDQCLEKRQKGASQQRSQPPDERPPRFLGLWLRGGLGHLRLVTADVGDECEEARPLDSRCQLTLMARAHAAQAGRKDLPLIRDEAAEGAIVLVVDPANTTLAERAAFLWS